MYIFTDLDGTLLGNNGLISDETYYFLRNHPSIFIVPCTGRGFTEIDSRVKALSPYIICSNGALIYSREERSFVHIDVLDSHLLTRIEAKLNGLHHVISLVTPDAVLSHRTILQYFLDRNDLIAYEDAKKYRLFFDDFYEIVKQINNVIKLHLNFWTVNDKKRAEDILAGGKYCVTSSDPLNIEITGSRASKRYGTQWVIKTLDINKKDIYCFGDSDNDLPLFEVGGINVAMVNGSDQIKKVADYVTEFSNDDNGVIRFLKKYHSFD